MVIEEAPGGTFAVSIANGLGKVFGGLTGLSLLSLHLSAATAEPKVTF